MPVHRRDRDFLDGELVYAARDLIRRSSRPPPQTGRMTLEKLTALIRAGYGQGHFHRYKPWLRTTKHDYSPVSLVGHLPVPEQKRLQHFRALAERSVMLLVRWLGSLDARDQFPAWPWSHEHPLTGLPGIVEERQLRGLEAIARDVGIKHGVYVGTNLPYVATIDVLVTWRARDGGYVLTAHDCKPESIVKAAPAGSRVHQRIALLRRYCAEAGIHHRLTHAEKLPQYLPLNLDALYPLLGPGALQHLRSALDYKRIVDELTAQAYDRPACEALEASACKWGVDAERAALILRVALWKQDLDHDLTHPLELYEPLQRGGRALQEALRKQWAVEGIECVTSL